MTTRNRLIVCRCCTAVGRHAGRRLCDRCYRACQWRGTLELFPRTLRPVADTYDDYLTLKQRNPWMNKREIAAELGMTYTALDRALVRARAALRAG